MRDALARWQPAVVVNCAAWTAVDDAEASEDAALRVNGDGRGRAGRRCAARGSALVQVSTDYVFDGLGRAAVPGGRAPAPRTAYGRTKLAGERAVLEQPGLAGYVVRTAWLYGAHGPNFVATMIRKEREQAQVHVVDDQRGQPTWTVDVADRILALVAVGGARRASTTRPAAARRPGSGWPGRCSGCAGADPARVRPAKSSALARPGAAARATACSAMPPGPGRAHPDRRLAGRRCSGPARPGGRPARPTPAPEAAAGTARAQAVTGPAAPAVPARLA